MVGAWLSLVPAGGGTQFQVRSDAEGHAGIGAVHIGDFRLTLVGSDPGAAIRFPLIVEANSALVMLLRVDEPSPGQFALNAQVITDGNNDAYSDDRYRLTITAQTASGGGTVLIEHGTSPSVPPEKQGTREQGSLDAEGNYTLAPAP